MSENTIQLIGIIGGILGMLGFCFAIIKYILPLCFKKIVKPKIQTKVSVGEVVDVVSPNTKEKLFIARESVVWISSSKNIEITYVTFRRLCRYQKDCMLYRLSLRADLLNDRKWCSYANVDDLIYTSSFMAPDDEKRVAHEHFVEGRLTLVPKEKRLVKETWVPLEIPLRLRDNKSHLVEMKFKYSLNIQETSPICRMINRIFNPVGRDIKHEYLERNVVEIINKSEEKEPEADTKKQRENSDEGKSKREFRIAVFYSGFHKLIQFQNIMKNLVVSINNLGDVKPDKKQVSGHEIRQKIKEQMPKTETVFNQPPDSKYHTVDMQTIKHVTTKIWPNIRLFAIEFLDCEAVSKLFPNSVKCIPLLPNIVQITFKYLVCARQSSRANIAINISIWKNKSTFIPIWVLWSELKNKSVLLLTKRRFRKEIDKMGKVLRTEKKNVSIGQAY